MGDMIYRIKHGQWVYDNRIFCDHLSILYVHDDSGDMLLKHGSVDRIRRLYDSGKYQVMEAQCNCEVRLLEDIPVKFVDVVNKCITTSASPWLSRLSEAVFVDKHTIDVECEVVDVS